VRDVLLRLGRCFASAFADGGRRVDPKESPMPDTRAHNEVCCPDCGLQWVASQGVHTRGCQHLDLAKRPSEMDDDELLRLALWLADGSLSRLAPSEPDWSAEDYRLIGAAVYGTASKSGKSQAPPSRPGPLSVGAGVGPSSSRPEPEPTTPEPEPPPQPTKPPEPEPPKPEAIFKETLGKVERLGYRLGRGIAVVLLVAVVAVPVAVVWWRIARS
jgi:hypothetical protein